MDKFYAVNIVDYHSLVADSPLHPIKLLLNPVLDVPYDSHGLVSCEGKKWDGDAICVKPDTEQERWDAIMEIIRNGTDNLPAYHKNLFRIYKSNTGKGSWKRI